MNLLYLTSDKIGGWEGGAKVTFHESEALKSLGSCEIVSQPNRPGQDVWDADGLVFQKLSSDHEDGKKYDLCHLYAGTFDKSIRYMKHRWGMKIVYTVAAHDVDASRKVHEELGLPFDYPHLNDPKLFKRYAGGYLELADVVVCPSSVAAETVRKQGRTGRIDVIPHGCDLPAEVKSLPKRFMVGNLGSWGADKSLHVLLQAWKKLAYRDATLVLAGRDSASDWARHLVGKYGGGNIQLMGWVDDIGNFFNKISLYVQSSATEGFSCEVAESMAHGRPVICSNRAGAVDMIHPISPVLAQKNWSCGCPFDYEGGPDLLAELIDDAKRNWDIEAKGKQAREIAEGFTWGKIRERYKALWRELL